VKILNFKSKRILDENKDVDLSLFKTIIRKDENIHITPNKPTLRVLKGKEYKDLDEFITEDEISKFNTIIRNNEELPLLGETLTILREGPKGVEGRVGNQGPKGDRGEKGSQGDVGLQGPQGPQGLKGDKGDKGIQGPEGKKGQRGEKGPQGIQGIPGLVGEKGDNGDPGPRGFKGEKGDRGEKGPEGRIGIQGDQGDTGSEGPRGSKGDKGDIGPKGDIGVRGPKGEKGDTGETGLQGEIGPRGDSGADGKPGKPGPKGDKGDLGVSGKEGKQGHQGIQGKIGPEGKVGPQGVQGPQGEKGDQGPQGEIGRIPNHQIQKHAVRFERPDGAYGNWINLATLAGDRVSGGGAHPITFSYGNSFNNDVRGIQFDQSSFSIEQIGNTWYITANSASGTVNPSTPSNFIYFVEPQNRILNNGDREFILTHTPNINSETISLNGQILSEGIDYTIDEQYLILDAKHITKANWIIRIQYTYSLLETTGIGYEPIPTQVY